MNGVRRPHEPSPKDLAPRATISDHRAPIHPLLPAGRARSGRTAAMTSDPNATPEGGPAAADPPADGRTARAERTRTAIVDALIALLEEGDLQPTANRIAERAGISLRLIYHHFGDLESLYRAVAQRTSERLVARSHRVPVDRPLDERIDLLVAQRADTLEWLTPVMRAAQLSIAPSPPGLFGSRSALHARGEREVDIVFARELDALPQRDRVVVASALNGALFWGHWDDLRRSGRSPDEAQASMVLTVRAIFAAVLDDSAT